MTLTHSTISVSLTQNFGTTVDAHDFTWVNEKTLLWDDIERTAEKINNNVGKVMINTDELFNEVIIGKKMWTSKMRVWETEEKEKDTKLSSEEKWLQLFSHAKENDIPMRNLGLIIECNFCLPGTSAPVERLFSLMNNAWADDRGLMLESTVRALMLYKINFGLSCEMNFLTK